MASLLTAAPRWLVLLSLVYAPWAFGCTRPSTIAVLNALLGTALALWLADCAMRRRLLRVHPVCVGCVGFLLLQGWWMTLNAHSLHDPDYSQFVPLVSWWKAGPGAVDRAVSFSSMLRVTALLGVICLVSDLSAYAAWRRRFWWTITLTGTSIVLFGLVQKVTGAPLLPFENVRAGSLYFATYFYHANGGAFINLVLPLAIGLAAVAARKSAKARTLLNPCAVICVAGAFINTSRAAGAVTLLLLAALAVWQVRVWRRELLELPRRMVAVYALLALLGLAVLAAAILPAARWSKLPGQINAENPRWISTQVCLRMLPEAGIWGFGPGTFAITFPHYTRELGASIPGIWRFAHDDYLQTIIEWGWAGASVSALLFFGGLVRCFHFCRRGRSAESALLFTSGLALCGVALHAAVDFPLQIASLQLYAAVYLGLGWGGTGVAFVRPFPVDGPATTRRPAGVRDSPPDPARPIRQTPFPARGPRQNRMGS